MLRLRVSSKIYRRAAGGSRAAAPSRCGQAPSCAPAPTQGNRGAAASSRWWWGQRELHPITPRPGGSKHTLGAPGWGCKEKEGLLPVWVPRGENQRLL